MRKFVEEYRLLAILERRLGLAMAEYESRRARHGDSHITTIMSKGYYTRAKNRRDKQAKIVKEMEEKNA